MENNQLELDDKCLKRVGEFWEMVRIIQSDDDCTNNIKSNENLLVYKSMQNVIKDDEILAGFAVLYYKHSSFRTLFKTAYKELNKLSVKK